MGHHGTAPNIQTNPCNGHRPTRLEVYLAQGAGSQRDIQRFLVLSHCSRTRHDFRSRQLWHVDSVESISMTWRFLGGVLPLSLAPPVPLQLFHPCHQFPRPQTQQSNPKPLAVLSWRPTNHATVSLLSVIVGERSDCSPRTKANRVQSPAGSHPDFRMWESCRAMPLVGGFSWGTPVSPGLSFRRCSILTSLTLIGSENLDVKSRPSLTNTGTLHVHRRCSKCPSQRYGLVQSCDVAVVFVANCTLLWFVHLAAQLDSTDVLSGRVELLWIQFCATFSAASPEDPVGTPVSQRLSSYQSYHNVALKKCYETPERIVTCCEVTASRWPDKCSWEYR
ncbi:hypothetical protein PR048_017126 [Dryococelus australis]|uniref:Uncharacterized protein n=1 Tax=Dryococelus australis TaxID=614101 RepID=A0ABQ9H8U0_9NEOP|nr:hypothetical protein PR048_017126 [Dryococelus australis]